MDIKVINGSEDSLPALGYDGEVYERIVIDDELYKKLRKRKRIDHGIPSTLMCGNPACGHTFKSGTEAIRLKNGVKKIHLFCSIECEREWHINRCLRTTERSRWPL